MPCYHPLRVALDDNGDLDWSIYDPIPEIHEIVLIPCRKCIGCTTSEARDWAIRCYHEALDHTKLWRDPKTKVTTEVANTSVVTLTYDPEHLPEDKALKPRDLQLFLKRLRNGLPPGTIRFFACGEYGDTPSSSTPCGRPHYHVLIFGEDFGDRYEIVKGLDSVGSVLGEEVSSKPLYGSYKLDRIWKLGRATVDDVDFPSVRYVTSYVAKKTHNDGKFRGPLRECQSEATGEVRIEPLQAEYRVMSKKPGLGKRWIERNFEDVYPADQIVIDGHEYPPPTFYDRWLRANHPFLYSEVQDIRLNQRLQAEKDFSPQRLAAAEEIKLAGNIRKQAI